MILSLSTTTTPPATHTPLQVVLIDDLVATGGTLLEAVKLVQALGGTVVE